jgi:hypothetical protein
MALFAAKALSPLMENAGKIAGKMPDGPVTIA